MSGVLGDLPQRSRTRSEVRFFAKADLQDHSSYNPAIFSKQYLLPAAPS
jgi:hypothetical protein